MSAEHHMQSVGVKILIVNTVTGKYTQPIPAIWDVYNNMVNDELFFYWISLHNHYFQLLFPPHHPLAYLPKLRKHISISIKNLCIHLRGSHGRKLSHL